MVISDLEYQEDVREEEEDQVEGGIAAAGASAFAVAAGDFFANTATSTATEAVSEFVVTGVFF